MIEKIILNHMKTELDVPCYMERPLEPPESFVLIERTGGSLNSHIIAEGTFAVQSYAGLLYDACELNESVLSALRDLEKEDGINFVKVDGYYNYTDTTTKRYRYQAVVRVGFYFMEE